MRWMTLAVAVVAMAGCGRHADRAEKMVQWRVDDALEQLDATPAQKERVDGLVKKLVSEAKPLAVQAKENRAVLVSEWKATTPDAAKVHRTVDAQLDSVRAFAHQVVDGVLEVHSLLTPEQRAKVSSRLDELQKR